MSPLLLVAALVTAAAGAAPKDPATLHGRELGRYVFLTYCAGCHGFDGLAFYPYAPSFAMGDRLAKSDAELMFSILKGRDAMPSWEEKLPLEWLEQALAYVRYVAKQARVGNNPVHNDRPDFFYLFVPMGQEMIMDWSIDH